MSEVSYARRLGLFSGTMAVVGGIIGSGIFLNPSNVARITRANGLTILVWVLGGFIAVSGAYCYAELGHRYPKAGGGYVYLREGFGKLPAFLYGWVLLLVVATGACAAVAYTFASYAAALFGLSESWIKPIAAVSIAALSIINYLGVGKAAVTQNLFTVLKLGALAALIICGLALPFDASHPVVVAAALPAPSGSALPLAIGAALTPILFAYGGWQQTSFIAEEIKDAERTLPLALLFGTAIVVVVYVTANLAYLRVLGTPGLGASGAPAADVMTAVVGPWGRRLISAGITCSTFGFLNLVILVSPRVYQAMAADGVFFPAMAKLHPKYQTPATAILLQGVWATLLAMTKQYGPLLDYVVFGDWIFFGLTAATIFMFRRRNGPPDRFGVPFYPVLPALFVISALYVVISSIASAPGNAAIGAGLLLLGVPVFFFWHRRGGATS
ncbi:MAG TPA: amino acid permease [Gemmatimonadales bacterium]